MEFRIKSQVVTRHQQVIDRSNMEAVSDIAFVGEEKHFDSEGRLLLSVTRQQDGSIEEKVEHMYEDHRQTTLYYIDEQEVSERTVIEFDAGGQPLSETIEYMDGTVTKSQWEYENGKPVKKTTIDLEEQEICGVRTWEYDLLGNLLSERVIEEGEMVFSREMTYDDQQRVVSQRTYREGDAGFITERFVWEGDRMLSMQKDDPSGHTETHDYQYDEFGNIIRAGNSGELKTETIIDYDAEGKPVREAETTSEGEVLYEITRVYDPSTGLISGATTYLNRRGHGLDLNYTLEYAYTFW